MDLVESAFLLQNDEIFASSLHLQDRSVGRNVADDLRRAFELIAIKIEGNLAEDQAATGADDMQILPHYVEIESE